MRRKKTIILTSKPTYQGYSHGFKMAIIERIENGQLSISQAAKEYDCSRSYNNFRPHFSCNLMTPDQAHLKGKFKYKKWG